MLGDTRFAWATRELSSFISSRITIMKLERRYSTVTWLNIRETYEKTMDQISHVAKHRCGIIPARNRKYRCTLNTRNLRSLARSSRNISRWEKMREKRKKRGKYSDQRVTRIKRSPMRHISMSSFYHHISCGLCDCILIPA